MTHCLLLGGGLLIAQAAKESPAVLKADRCHYIIQGATVERASRLYASGRGGCVKDWHSFANPEQRFAALRLYRKEVEAAFLVPDFQLRADLAKIDAEDKAQ